MKEERKKERTGTAVDLCAMQGTRTLKEAKQEKSQAKPIVLLRFPSVL
jgi:hypothetical protein